MMTMIYRIAVMNDGPGRDGPAGIFDHYASRREMLILRVDADGNVGQHGYWLPEECATPIIPYAGLEGLMHGWKNMSKTHQLEWGAKNKAGKEVFVNDVIEYVGTKVLTWIEDLEYLMWLLMNVPASDYKVIGDINTNPMLLQKLK